MLYHLLFPLHESLSLLNVMRYITFRTAAASLTALALSLLVAFGLAVVLTLWSTDTHAAEALAEQPSPNTHSNLLFALNFLPDIPPEEIFAEHRRWHTLHAAPLTAAAPLPVPARRDGSRR